MRSALALALLLFGSAAQAATLEKLAVEGDAAPDPGFTFRRRFFDPTVGDAPDGRVVAVVRLIPASSRYCVVKFDPAGPDTILACQREATPDAHQYVHIYPPTVGALGAAWPARVTFERSGIYRGDPTIVDLEGDPVPGGPGLLENYRAAAITDAGDVVFAADISGAAVVGGVEVDHGYFRCTGGDGNCHGGTGTLETLVLVNDPVPDRPGRRLCRLDAFAASTYGVAFRAGTRLDCANSAESLVDGTFRLAFGGGVETLALVGEASQPSPVVGGTTYGFVSGPPAIADTGMVAFLASTRGVFQDEVLYRCDPAVCPAARAAVVVSQGDQDAAGNAFEHFTVPGVSDAGDVGFQARARTPDRKRIYGVWVAHPAPAIETIALTGDPVPSVAPAATFTGFGRASMSPAGKVAFKGKIRAVAPPRTKREGLFLWE